MTHQIGEFATAREVADTLCISPGSLAQDRYLGKGIPFIRIGKRVRYRWSDVEKYLADNTVRGGDAA